MCLLNAQESHRDAAEKWLDGLEGLQQQLRDMEGVAQGTPEWHALRAPRLTASNFHNVLGYKTSLSFMFLCHNVTPGALNAVY